jgi:hypothetical protein
LEPLFCRVLGESFATLSPRVRALHLREGTHRYRGEVEVERGHGLLARMCGRATLLPPAGHGPIEVEIAAGAVGEHWSRHVGGYVMRSRLWDRDGLLHERLGLVTFAFRLVAHDGGIAWRVVRASALGVPLPLRWFDGVAAREGERDGRYTFDVCAVLPVAGLLARYRGWLDVD